MSKILYVCLRDPLQAPATSQAVAAIAGRLVPDNLGTVMPLVIESGGIVVGMSTPSDMLGIRGTSIAAGYLVDPGQWERPRSGRPDGAYALFRSDDGVVEVVSDTLASRTVWYVLTDRMFIASTSQRAIVALLGSFEFNPAVVPWMLASGTLGPGLSWDKRIRHVAGATTVTLDRRAWTVVERTEPTQFIARHASDDEFERDVSNALIHVVGAARVADPRWAIALSGGVDSRVILSLLRDTKGLRAVTWGLRALFPDKTGDAQVAQRLAQRFGLEHQYFETDLSPETMEQAFERFVANGEARIDHISGYADGFQLWRRMVDTGIQGIIRGEQAFGHRPVRSQLDARTRAGLTFWSDFSALPTLDRFAFSSQALPDGLQQRTGESNETWRDRLCQQFRVPLVYGALNDLKLPYVEIISPLLSNSLIEIIRELPDALRTRKPMLRQIAASATPSIPFATSSATQPRDDILRDPRVVRLLQDRLSDRGAAPAIRNEFAAYVVAGLSQTTADWRANVGKRIRRASKAWTPSWIVRKRARSPATPTMDFNRLAFRAFLVTAAHRLFSEDAGYLAQRIA